MSAYTVICSECGYEEIRDTQKQYPGIPRHCNKVMKLKDVPTFTVKEPQPFIICEEEHPLRVGASIWRCYRTDMSSLFIGEETPELAEKRLRIFEVTSEVTFIYKATQPA